MRSLQAILATSSVAIRLSTLLVQESGHPQFVNVGDGGVGAGGDAGVGPGGGPEGDSQILGSHSGPQVSGNTVLRLEQACSSEYSRLLMAHKIRFLQEMLAISSVAIRSSTADEQELGHPQSVKVVPEAEESGTGLRLGLLVGPSVGPRVGPIVGPPVG